MQDADTNKIRYTLVSKDDKENQKEADEIIDFIGALRVVMHQSEGDTDLDMFMKNNYHLNHPPLHVMHSLAKEENIPKFILNIKKMIFSTVVVPWCHGTSY